MRNGHVKDAAQDEAEDVTQDVAEDVLGAAEDGRKRKCVHSGTRHHPAAEPTPNTRIPPLTLPLGDT